jgi:hypothetical protein
MPVFVHRLHQRPRRRRRRDIEGEGGGVEMSFYQPGMNRCAHWTSRRVTKIHSKLVVTKKPAPKHIKSGQ